MKFKKARILVVEDDLAMQSLLTEFLELQGHSAQAFRVATQALDSIASQVEGGTLGIDLIISDINMPQMNGLDFLRQVRGISPQVPVILISAFGTDNTQALAVEAGASAYLNKPFKLSDLKEVVSHVLQPVA